MGNGFLIKEFRLEIFRFVLIYFGVSLAYCCLFAGILIRRISIFLKEKTKSCFQHFEVITSMVNNSKPLPVKKLPKVSKEVNIFMPNFTGDGAQSLLGGPVSAPEIGMDDAYKALAAHISAPRSKK